MAVIGVDTRPIGVNLGTPYRGNRFDSFDYAQDRYAHHKKECNFLLTYRQCGDFNSSCQISNLPSKISSR